MLTHARRIAIALATAMALAAVPALAIGIQWSNTGGDSARSGRGTTNVPSQASTATINPIENYYGHHFEYGEPAVSLDASGGVWTYFCGMDFFTITPDGTVKTTVPGADYYFLAQGAPALAADGSLWASINFRSGGCGFAHVSPTGTVLSTYKVSTTDTIYVARAILKRDSRGDEWVYAAGRYQSSGSNIVAFNTTTGRGYTAEGFDSVVCSPIEDAIYTYREDAKTLATLVVKLDSRTFRLMEKPYVLPHANSVNHGNLSCGATGTVFVPNENTMVAIWPDMTKRYEYTIEGANGYTLDAATAASTPDGTTYFTFEGTSTPTGVRGMGGVMSLDPNGNLRWARNADDPSIGGTVYVGPDGRVAFAGWSGWFSYDANGANPWFVSARPEGFPYTITWASTPIPLPDGSLIAVTNDGLATIH